MHAASFIHNRPAGFKVQPNPGIPMVLRTASEMLESILKQIAPHYDYLSGINTGIPQAVTKTHWEMLELLKNDRPQLFIAIHDFALLCQEQLSSTASLVKELRTELKSCKNLYGKVADKVDQQEHPENELNRYLVCFERCFTRLEAQFKNETDPEVLKKDVQSLPRAFRISPLPAQEIPLTREVVPPLALPAGPVLPPENSKETAAANHTSSPQPEFPLPDFLEPLNLKPEEKQRIRKLLEFIATEREKGPNPYYNLKKYNQRIFAGLVAGVDLIFASHVPHSDVEKYMGKLFQGHHRDARDYVSLYRDPENSLAPEKYHLRKDDRFRELEMAVLAYLEI